jgi:hypothetical protein
LPGSPAGAAVSTGESAGVFAGCTGADADGLLQRSHIDPAVAAATGVGGVGNDFDHRAELLIGDGDFDLDLQAEAGHAFRPAVWFQLGDALDFGGRESGNADFLKRRMMARRSTRTVA